MSGELAAAGDRDIPDTHVGTIEPNYYCRAWNPRRAKYCGSRAGWGTDHKGGGRCKIHDGGAATKLLHGQRRRYEFTTATALGDLIAQHADHPDPLNILEEIALARAMLHDFVDRYTTSRDAILAWHEAQCDGKDAALPKVVILDVADAAMLAERVTKMAARYVEMQGRNAITFDQLKRFLFAAERVIEGEVRDALPDSAIADRVVRRINSKIRGIRP